MRVRVVVSLARTAALVLLCTPLVAYSATIAELQAQLAALRAQLSALQSRGSVPVAQSSGACPHLSRNLSRGSTGTDVICLQNLLISQAFLATENSTGFFGALTESAVKKFQCVHMRICSGTIATTGYGLVGSRTRAALLAKTAVTLPTTSPGQPAASSSAPNSSRTPTFPSAPSVAPAASGVAQATSTSHTDIPHAVTVTTAQTAVSAGQTLTVTWNSQRAPQDSAVRLELISSTGRIVHVLSGHGGVETSGSYNWTVPARTSGSYKVRATLYVTPGSMCRETPNATRRIFMVSGNKILAPNGNPTGSFKGVHEFAYLLSGAPELGTSRAIGGVSWNRRAAFIRETFENGMNIVRVGIGPGNALYKDQVATLDEAIRIITQYGIVVLLHNDGGTFDENREWLKFVGRRYRENPLVWVNPANEINCNSFRSLNLERELPPLDTINCDNLDVWRREMVAYVASLRGEGFRNPIVVHSTNYSHDIRPILPHLSSLNAQNIILGVHVYPPNGNDPAYGEGLGPSGEKLDDMFGTLAAQYPILIDEYGNGIAHFGLNWNKDGIDYVTNWVNTRQGLGVIGFYWTGITSNPSFVDFHRMRNEDGTFTAWGTWFRDKVFGAVLAQRITDLDSIPPPQPLSCTFPDPHSLIATGESATITLQ